MPRAGERETESKQQSNKASIADLTVPLSLSASDFFRLHAKPMRHANSERQTSKPAEPQIRSIGLKRAGQIFDRALR
jgi:hypothetical protein